MVPDSPRRPLREAQLPLSVPGPDQMPLPVRTRAVCRTNRHVVDGELPEPKLPLVPGHGIVGTVVTAGGTRLTRKAWQREPAPD
jgi:propanol-preferring alcohol dehydrogenase